MWDGTDHEPVVLVRVLITVRSTYLHVRATARVRVRARASYS